MTPTTLREPREVFSALAARYRMILAVGFLGALAAGLYMLLIPAPWMAMQVLVVRNEAVNTEAHGPGRFRIENELKTAQETILELASSYGVVRGALEDVGPPKRFFASDAQWPDEEAVADTQEAITVVAPNGTELGKSEVMHLRVKDQDRARAVGLAIALCNRLEEAVRRLRDQKAGGLVLELNQAVAVARGSLDEVTGRLAVIEREVGGNDLADLRMLEGMSVGDSDLRRKLVSIETELREARVAYRSSEQLAESLEAALDDAGNILATPNRLIEAQPALKKLKEGLVEAQIRQATLLGTMTEDHPQVKAARAAEASVVEHIRDELPNSISGVRMEMDLVGGRIALLEGQLREVSARLDKLAHLRSRYANLTAELKQRQVQLEKSEKDLHEARASQAAALSGSPIHRIDQPMTGPRPLGPRKLIVVLSGFVAGLLVGAGLVLLTMDEANLPVVTAPQHGPAALNGSVPHIAEEMIHSPRAAPAAAEPPALPSRVSYSPVMPSPVMPNPVWPEPVVPSPATSAALSQPPFVPGMARARGTHSLSLGEAVLRLDRTGRFGRPHRNGRHE